jgi:hypothetical protein
MLLGWSLFERPRKGGPQEGPPLQLRFPYRAPLLILQALPNLQTRVSLGNIFSDIHPQPGLE